MDLHKSGRDRTGITDSGRFGIGRELTVAADLVLGLGKAPQGVREHEERRQQHKIARAPLVTTRQALGDTREAFGGPSVDGIEALAKARVATLIVGEFMGEDRLEFIRC